MDVLLYVLAAIIILLSLPSTMYLGVFTGVFGRRSNKRIAKHERARIEASPQLKSAIAAASALPHTIVSVTAADGLKLYADYYNNGGSKTAILVHGYHATPLFNFAVILRSLLGNGYNILLLHQRAHGNSGGRFTTFGIKEADDLLKWVDWADKTDCTGILVYGVSMGATAVGYASGKISSSKVKALVMDCGFTGVYNELIYMMKRRGFEHCGFTQWFVFLAKKLLKIDMKQSVPQSLAKCTIPVLFLHGTADVEVPPEFTEENYAACAAPKGILRVPGARHATNILQGGPETLTRFYEFINEYI